MVKSHFVPRLRAGVLAVAGAVLLLSCAAAESSSGRAVERRTVSPSSTSPARAQKAASFAEIELPSSADNFKVYSESGLDTLVLLSFRMDKSQLEQFRRRSGLPEFSKGNRTITQSEGKLLDWQLGKLTQFLGVSDGEGRPLRYVMVDTSSSTSVMVYVEAHTT